MDDIIMELQSKYINDFEGMFKNGNIHVWFNDERLLAKLNYLCGSHFGWIPSEGEQKAEGEAGERARSWVAKEFGDIGEVKLLQA